MHEELTLGSDGLKGRKNCWQCCVISVVFKMLTDKDSVIAFAP